MKEYAVKITEVSEKVVYIEAQSRIEAEALVEENWKNSEYILDAEDFKSVEFEAVEKEV